MDNLKSSRDDLDLLFVKIHILITLYDISGILDTFIRYISVIGIANRCQPYKKLFAYNKVPKLRIIYYLCNNEK